MGLNFFTFNGQSSLDYGIYVGGQGTFNAPQRDVTKVSIPGRNGDLIKDNGRWLNIEVPYNIVVMDEFKYKTDAVRAWLSQPKTYARLEDTYHPEYFRLARFIGPIDFETSAWNKTGKATVVFDCKPQRFLKDGESLVEMANGGTILNPTLYESKPLIRIVCTGSGTVTVGNYIIEVSDISTYVDVDCEIMNCYANGVSMNHKVRIDGRFPIIPPNKVDVEWTGDITKVYIAGRWYTV